jgi:hypothetical protein
MTQCRNCGNTITANFCGNCGQAAELHRINGRYIRHEIEHILHFEKGILFTVRELFIRPGKAVKAFISENRGRLVKPVVFLIVTSVIYSLVSHWMHIAEAEAEVEAPHGKIVLPATQFIMEWVAHHYGYANLLMGVFIALWLKLFFMKQGYNFFEILILLCFVIGTGMLIITLFAVIEGVTHRHVFLFSLIPVLIYSSWGVGQFFEPKKVGSYLKALVAYILGVILFGFVLVFTGLVIDLLILR